MDLQTYLNNTLAAKRSEVMAKSDQLTLGEIILKCEAIAAKGSKLSDGSEPHVVYDFEYLYPTKIDSWRGSYEELALSFDGGRNSLALSDFISLLKTALDNTFTGYKGGEYTMSRHTPVWVANYGNSGSTAVVEVVDRKYEVILMTGYREF